jgi:DNA-binding response OmpR family regulator
LKRPAAFVIEDDEDIGEIYTAALREAQYEPIYIQNGLEALDKLKTVAPDLVVLDLHIPKLTGATVLRAIRSDTRMANACIIVVTADALLAENLKNDADTVLVKPVGFTKIRELAERRYQLHSTSPIQ